MSYEVQVALTVAAVIIGVIFVIYFGLGALFFFIALGNKKRKDPTIPCKDSLFERNADNENLIAGYKWFDSTYHQEVIIKNRKGKNIHAVEFLNPVNTAGPMLTVKCRAMQWSFTEEASTCSFPTFADITTVSINL